jgi:ABC transport system ATP-binding/permease protein
VRRRAVTVPPSSPDWELEIGGLRIPLADTAIVLGRDPGCDLPLQDERVSWRHVQVELREGAPLVTDLGSSNGTYLDGAKIGADAIPISAEAIIQIGSTRARLREVAAEPSAAHGRFRRVPVRRRPLGIGRAPENDVVLDEPNVSWRHAELRPGSPPTLVDLGSRNGVRLGNRLVQGSSPLPPGAPAGIGPFALRYENGELIVVDERGGLSLSARQVSVEVEGKVILHPTSLNVAPGEFAALIGPSGSGKTTLVKCLAGVTQASRGLITIGGDPLELRLTDVGYVPQSDVVHDRLTVREALLYAARLRLPSDTHRKEHGAAVDGVLEELRLGEHAGTAIGRLSGGQRKRVACGVELIGQPTMLLLDEPTSGLDPALERRMMLMLRRLADSGRGIVVVTHATSSLAMCDTVAVMASGGHLMFGGSPRESLEHFEVRAYDEIYGAIELSEVPTGTIEAPPARPQRARARLLSGRSLYKQTTTLAARYARTFVRDRRTLAILLGQAPVMAVLIALLYPSNVLRRPDLQPTRSAQFIFLLVTAAIWLGLIDACREIVKERSIVLRELAVGVRLDAYLLAKSSLLFTLAAVQCIVLVGVATALQPLHGPASSYLSVCGVLILASFAAVGVGLVVSTLARSVDQATSLIPLLLIPLLLFGGALVPLAQMAPPVRAIADLMISRWAFAGAGHAIDMEARLAHAPRVGSVTGYGTTFFSLGPAVCAIVLAGLTATLLLACALLLAVRSRRPT